MSERRAMPHCKIESIPCNPNENRSLPCGRRRFFVYQMAEREARIAWKCAIPARCEWFCGSCAAPYDALSPMEDGGREMTHRHSCSRSVLWENHWISYFRVMAKSISYATITMYIQACNQSPLRFYEWKGCQHHEKTHWSVFIRAPVSAASFRDDPAARLG